MAVKVLELHHHGIRIGPSPEAVATARKFYGDVLGLDHDPGRPHIPSIDGYWMDVGGTAQIHLMGVDYWVSSGVVSPQSQQIFMYDPFGNMVELHQADTCRCVAKTRP